MSSKNYVSESKINRKQKKQYFLLKGIDFYQKIQDLIAFEIDTAEHESSFLKNALN